MTDPCFFGYGSLVNRATQDYPDARRAWLSGWRRMWQSTGLRDQAFLSVLPDPTSEIAGLVARVPGADWAELDLRETGYARHPVTLRSETTAVSAQVYAVEARHFAENLQPQPILLSYLDVVLQGYLREFGTEGVAAFVDTTDGWERPILDDRADPIYPRAQRLDREETQLVDGHIAALGCEIWPKAAL